MPQGNHSLPKPDCTSACQSLIHGSIINAVITKRAVTDKQLASYISSLCCNFSRVRDETGRTALHMAASCGRLGLCRWLVKYCDADLNARDKENASTPLHRSIFYGQIHVAVFLIKVGASTLVFDEDDLLCFDVVNSLDPGLMRAAGGGQAYVWGVNSNYTHGSGSQQARTNPELVDYFRRNNIVVGQICMDKFHTVFRGEDGRAWACGLGQGGRLGLDSEGTFITPQPMRTPASEVVSSVAVGRDHTILLTENGSVLSCGLNTHHQLGHSPPPAKLLVARAINLRSLKVSNVIGISAARFHSVFWTKDAVYTFGLHAGQLGHPNIEDSKELTVIVPRVVPCLDKEAIVVYAAASDGATVIVVRKSEVCVNPTVIMYVLHRYQTKRLASKLPISSVCVVGGTLNARSDTKSLIEQGGQKLQLLTLTTDGMIHVWQETQFQLQPCTFNLQRRLVITDVCLSRSNVLFSTHDGNGFIGNLSTKSPSNGADVPHIELQRLPHLHRTTSITCDPKGRNFAAVQVPPRSLITPKVAKGKLSQDLASLLVDASETDSLHDITFEVGGERYPAHKYILSLNSSLGEKNERGSIVKVDNIHPQIFHQLLLFIYSADCDLIHPGPCRIKIMNNSKREDPIRLLAAAATEFKVNDLCRILQFLRYDGSKILKKEGFNGFKKLKPIALDHNLRKDLYDVVIAGNDGGTIQVHKCVLTARLEYFRHMLCGGWVESTVASPLVLPFSTAVLIDLVSFLYSDSESSLSNPDDLDHVCSVLIAADELLVTRLKEICELALSVCLNLRNAGLLLQFSSTYNALQLHKCCMSFIAVNLAAILEMRTLDIVSLDVLNSLSEYIRATVFSLANHVITPFSDAPKDEQVILASEKFPVPWDEEDEYSSINDLGWESEWLKNHLPDTKQNKSFLSSTPVAARKKQQTRKLSTNEAQRRRYESVGSIRDLEKTLESPLSRSFNDGPEHLKEDESSPGVERLLKNHVVAQLEDDDFDPSLFIKLPGSVSRNRKNSSGDSIDDKSFPSLTASLSDTSSFPELSEQLTSLKITPKKKSSTSNVKRSAPVKLSQKQQKKLAAESISPSNKSATIASSPPTCAWANISSPETSTSFIDILRETKNHHSSSSPIDRCSVKSSSPQTSKGIPNLSDIVADELKQKENWSKMRSKPFHLTQIEDKAIENLLAFYNAENVFDERITVQRVVRGTVAMPTWFKSKR